MFSKTTVTSFFVGNSKRLASLTLATLLAVSGLPTAVFADAANNTPPIIGRQQILQWNGVDTGQTDNTPLDGTIFCAAFGGPDNVPPPAGRFANNFVFDGVLGQFRPTTVDVGVTQSAILPTDRDQNWIYAFQFINDDGDVAGEGGAAINSINVSLPPCTSGIDNSFPDPVGSTSGLYVTEFGSTAIVNASVINFFQIQVPFFGVGRQFSLIYAQNILQPGQASQIFYYYSPFSPSNRNVSINGGTGGQSLAHATINQVVTAQFYPFFDCTIDPIARIELDLMTGNEIQVDVTVNNSNRSLDFVSNDPLSVGNILLVDNGMGGTIPQHENVRLDFTSAQEALGCVDFRSVSGGPAVPSPLNTILDVNKDGSLGFSFFVFVQPNYFDTCGSPLTISNLLTAQSPYDKDPPFEGHTKFGSPTDPSLDTDSEVNGQSCTVDVTIGQPPMVEITKAVQFLDFTNPGNPAALPPVPVDQVDSPPCGKVKFTITVTATADNQESITNYVLNDVLPAGLTFANAVDPPGVMIDEVPPGSGMLSVTGIPDLAPGASFSFCFRACVDPGTPPGVLTNTTDVIAEGVDTGIPTNNPSDSASVNVLMLAMSLTNEGVNDDIICPPQQAVFTFQVCNDGTHALDVTIPPANLDAQLNLISQNPAGGSVVTLNPAQCQQITVTVQAVGGGPANDFNRCVRLDPVVGHPDMVDPGNLDCDISRNAEQCINVIDPRLNAVCTEVNPGEVTPGGMVTMTKTITNTGNITLDPVLVDCAIDPDLDVPMGAIPSDLGPLNPGQSVDILFTATVSATAEANDLLCVICSYVGHPTNLPPGDTSCDPTAASTCCTRVEGRDRIPTLSEWGLIALVAAFGGLLVRRRMF